MLKDTHPESSYKSAVAISRYSLVESVQIWRDSLEKYGFRKITEFKQYLPVASDCLVDLWLTRQKSIRY